MRFLAPVSRTAAISASGMPHRPKPPTASTCPSLITPSSAALALGKTLSTWKPRSSCRHAAALHRLVYKLKSMGVQVNVTGSVDIPRLDQIAVQRTPTSSRCLSPGSICPRAPEQAEGWIPVTSAGMTACPSAPARPCCDRCRAPRGWPAPPVLDVAAVHDVAHGELGDLAGLGARDVGDLDDPGRHVARAGAGADLLLDALAQGVVERDAGLQDHEQHDAHVVVPVLADDDRSPAPRAAARPGGRSRPCRCARRRD